MAELRMKEDLVVLDVMQVQNICVRKNLDSTGRGLGYLPGGK